MADSDRSAPERYQLFEAGWRRAECALSDLWVQYLGVGGHGDLFSLDGFMHGLMSLPPGQQDILAHAINEQLDDVCQAAKVPYLYGLDVQVDNPHPLTVLDHLLGRAPVDTSDEPLHRADDNERREAEWPRGRPTRPAANQPRSLSESDPGQGPLSATGLPQNRGGPRRGGRRPSRRINGGTRLRPCRKLSGDPGAG